MHFLVIRLHPFLSIKSLIQFEVCFLSGHFVDTLKGSRQQLPRIFFEEEKRFVDDNCKNVVRKPLS